MAPLAGRRLSSCDGSPDREPAAEAEASCGVDGTPESRRGGTRSQRCSERYSSLVQCGGALFLFSRVEMLRTGPKRAERGIHDDRWHTIVRSGPATDHPLLSALGKPRVAMPAEWNMSHNAAFLCLAGGKVAAYGGRRKAKYFKHPYIEPGILRTLGTPDGTGGLTWSQPERVVTGSVISSGCIDRRIGQVDGAELVCEFDGKLSVIHFRNKTFLYARANTLQCGGRAVQVISSADGVRNWSRWRLLTFDGLSGRIGVDPSLNIYFFNVHAFGEDRLLATFPAAMDSDEGGVYIATSVDGVHWSRPQRLLKAMVFSEWRTNAWPVDGNVLFLPTLFGRHSKSAEHTGGTLMPIPSLLVEHGVRLEHGDALHQCPAQPLTCRYNITLQHLSAPSFDNAGSPLLNDGAWARERSINQMRFSPPQLLPTFPPRSNPPRREEGHPTQYPEAFSEWGQPKPLQPRRCASSENWPAHVLLFRGQPFRWGCSPSALRRQAGAYRSYFDYMILPIESAGGCVRVILSSSSMPCGVNAYDMSVSLFGSRVVASEVIANATSQAEGVASAVRLLRQHERPTDQTLFFTRHDVVLRAVIGVWECKAAIRAAEKHSFDRARRGDDTTAARVPMGFASQCEAAAWESYRCINDVLFVIPRPHMPSFFASIGSQLGMSNNRDGQCGCFAPRLPVRTCAGGNRQSSGHDCYNVFVKIGGLTAADLEACWMAPSKFVGERGSLFYELPHCEDVDRASSYHGRACARDSKGANTGGRKRGAQTGDPTNDGAFAITISS